jgi:hypothetical protein
VGSEEIDQSYPFAQHLKTAAVFHAKRRAREDPAGAVDEILVLYRFGEDFGAGGSAICYLVGVTVRAAALNALADLAGAGRLTSDQEDRLLAWLRTEMAKEPDLLAVADREALSQRQTFLQLIRGELDLAETGVEDLSQHDIEKVRKSLYRIIALYGEDYAEARQADVGALGVALMEKSKGRLVWMVLAFEPVTSVIYYAFINMGSLVYLKLPEAPDRLYEHQAAAVLVIQTRRYEEKHGRYPATMEELVGFAGPEFDFGEWLIYVPVAQDTGKPAFYGSSDVEEHGLGDKSLRGSIR